MKQAWKDGKMSADESAMLDTLRKSLNISPEEHIKIEQDVRVELADGHELPDITEQSPNGGEGVPHAPDFAIEPPAREPPKPETPVSQPPMPKAPTAHKPTGDDEAETNDIKGLLTAGKNSYHKGNYEEAIEYCDKVLLLDPDNSEALFFRKRTLSKIEKLTGKMSAGAGKAEAKAETAVEPKETPGEVAEPATSSGVGGAVEGGIGGGDPNCKSCKGSGQCHWCKGSGQCYWCKGSGKCDKCGGTGKMGDEQCKSCKGTGKCHSCNGDGKCYWCGGGGRCSKCSK